MSIGRNAVITTVKTAAASIDLTSLLNVRADLNLPDADPTIDIYLSRIITQISGGMQSECNRTFAYQVYKDTVRPGRDTGAGIDTSPEYIPTARIPLVSVASIIEDGTTLVVDTDYEVDVANSRVYRLNSSGNLCKWRGNKIVIEYGSGWTLPSALVSGPNPLLQSAPELEAACIDMVKARYIARDRDPFLKSDTVEGVGSQTFWIPDVSPGKSPDHIQDILDDYRIPVIA